MGFMDAIAREDRVEMKFSDFYELVKQAAQLETVMNGVNCDVPHKYIREMQSGKKEPGPAYMGCQTLPNVVIGIDLAGEQTEAEPEEENREEQQEPEATPDQEERKDNEHV